MASKPDKTCTPIPTSTPVAAPTLLPPPLTATSIPTVTPVPTLAIDGDAGQEFLDKFFINAQALGTPAPEVTLQYFGIGGMLGLTEDQKEATQGYMRRAIHEFAANGGGTADQLTYLFASIYAESKWGKYMTEPENSPNIAGYASLEGLCNRNDFDIAKKYRGRGFIQITGRCQYAYLDQVHKVHSLGLLDNPDDLATKPATSMMVSVHAMVNGQLTCIDPLNSDVEDGKDLVFRAVPCVSEFTLRNYDNPGPLNYRWDNARDIINGGADAGQRAEISGYAIKFFGPVIQKACRDGILPPAISCE